MKRNILVAVLFLGAICGGYWYFFYRTFTVPRMAFDRLVSGDDTAHIISLVFGTGKQKIVIEDPELTKVFNDAFRGARDVGILDSGQAWRTEIVLSSGVSISTVIYVSTEPGALFVGEPHRSWIAHDPYHSYRLSFPESVPDSFTQLLSRLRRPIRE
jgi:hypothetical protein